MRYLAVIAGVMLIMVGCVEEKSTQSEATHNPTAEEVLSANDEADIFQFNGLIYSNASDLEWVQENPYQKGEQIGEIAKQTSVADEFESEAATKLPVGIKIYNTIEGGRTPLIVEVDGQEVVYIALIEG